MQQIYLNFLNKKDDENSFKKINSNIEIDFKKYKVPISEKLKTLN